MTSEFDIVQQFITAMHDRDIVPVGDIEVDAGKILRFHVDGDRKGSKNGWYILFSGTPGDPKDPPAGAFGCNKRYGEKTKFTWKLDSTVEFTPEERRAYAIKMRERAERKAREEAERHAAAASRAEHILAEASEPTAEHPYCKRKKVKVYEGMRVGAWPITNPETGEVSVVSKNALLIPMRDVNKKVWGVQAIFPDKRNFLKRDKDFLAGSRIEGCFFTLGKPVDKTIILGEGFATCATIHDITGHAVVVCFVRGNLKTVAIILRKKFPDYRIIVAADNDQWTLEPVNNPGLTDASAAAIAVGGLLAVPPFTDADKTAKITPTDFNDLAELKGADAVLHEFAAPFDPSIQEPEVAPHLHLIDTSLLAPEPPAPEATQEDRPDIPTPIQGNSYFSVLGYEHGNYYFFQKEKRQIMIYTKGDFSDGGFIELAPLGWWEGVFPAQKGGIEKRFAMNALVRFANARGIYDMSRIRGRGAWRDKGRSIYHHGNMLTVDGVETEITDLENSSYVYELSKSLPELAQTALNDEEGKRILDLASIFRWSKPGSAALLAGWVALAPLCGAIKWRPHIWITGGAGSGKTTILNEFVHHLMDGRDLYAQGSSSEAGIRQELKGDALPVLFDESESNTERDSMRIQNVLSLIRQASSELQAKTFKGTAGGDALSFHIRSMFCLSSIQVGIKFQADIERLTVLALQPKREDTDAAGTWVEMSAMIAALQADEELPGRLFRRSLELLPITLNNIRIFAEVAATKFGSQRDGDQYGALLAGAFSLISTKEATYADAAELIEQYDWSEHRENNEVDEGSRAIAALMEAHVRVGGGPEVTVNELIRVAKGYEVDGLTMANAAANAILERHGMRVNGLRLVLSNTSRELRRLMEGTEFEADLRGVLLRSKGADKFDNQSMKFNGVASKCISIPLEDLISDDLPQYVRENF